jgi:hypothetical protein
MARLKQRFESEEPQEKSKKQRRRDEIEMGLDLINSLFGN